MHADTVYGAEQFVPYREDKSGKIFGSGVADNKGGIVIALTALETLHGKGKLQKATRPLNVFSSSCEEVGSPGFLDFIKGLGTNQRIILGTEPALAHGNIISKRRGNKFFEITIKGNSVHTGRDLKRAANPVTGLEIVLALLRKLSGDFPGVSVSANGVRSEPNKFNVSPQALKLLLDVRFEDNSLAHIFQGTLEKSIGELEARSPDGSANLEFSLCLADDCPSFATEKSSDLITAQEIYSKCAGKKIYLDQGQGASDCCYFARPGLQILDGLGPEGGAIHSTGEFIFSASLSTRAAALAQYLEFLLM